jgi:uncharacterized protein
MIAERQDAQSPELPAPEVLAASLRAVLAGMGSAAVAVSGGVDSMTLAEMAHRTLGAASMMLHASSPAVPAEATERVVRHAALAGWRMRVIDAAELSDPSYAANPVNRCFFCKTNLYAAIGRATDMPIVSGANLDDLGEYRPGLDAAREHGVRHPFLEADIGKAGVRALARHLGLAEVASLPAAPCLSSRVETGIAIRPRLLAAIHAAERMVARALPEIGQDSAVRCRLRRAGVVVELDPASLSALGEDAALAGHIAALFREAGVESAVSFAAYRNGSAFLREGVA